MQRVEEMLAKTVELGGSDLHFKADTGKVYMRVMGDLKEVEGIPTYSADEIEDGLQRMLRPGQWERFQRDMELDFSYELKGVSRFRGNLYVQRSSVQAAFRVIPYEIQSMEDLQLPPSCYDFIQRPRGLVLVTGPAGSGKSTTLAAMIDRLNRTTKQHIITVEDPIEFVHDDHMALMNQRELDVDTNSFANALKHVLRQDPDVILVGEMRDLETIHLAITAAETGHLVFATLHTVDAVQTVDRIVDVFPTYQQQQVRMQLSVNLIGVISQTLVKRKDERGRAAAFEVLAGTPAVRNLIRENKSYQINSIIQTGHRQGMQTLDQSLVKLVDKGILDKEAARFRSKDRGEFDRLLAAGTPQTAPPAGGAGGYAGPKPTEPGAPPTSPPVGGVRGQPNRPGYQKDPGNST